jgi:hypothetical protein
MVEIDVGSWEMTIADSPGYRRAWTGGSGTPAVVEGMTDDCQREFICLAYKFSLRAALVDVFAENKLARALQ